MPPTGVVARLRALVLGVWTVCTDTLSGLYFLARHGLAVVGLLLAVLFGYLLWNPEETASREQELFGWLLARQEIPDTDIPELKKGYRTVIIPADPSAAGRATVQDWDELTEEQRRVVTWLSKKYRVAPQPMGALVQEAYTLGKTTRIDPLLIMAVMAIESRYNPYAESSVGAQGLMQVMTPVHQDKYSHFGGNHAAFDPITNMRVGVKILHETIALSGSVEGGLRRYVGATTVYNEGGYGKKVLAEYARIKRVAEGGKVRFNARLPYRKPDVRVLPALSIQPDQAE